MNYKFEVLRLNFDNEGNVQINDDGLLPVWEKVKPKLSEKGIEFDEVDAPTFHSVGSICR